MLDIGIQTKEELELYAAIASNSSDMMALLDENYTYLATNQAYLNVFGLTKDQIVGHTIIDVFGEDFFSNSIKPRADKCLSGKEVRFEDWFKFPEVGKRYMAVTYSPYRTENSEINGFVVSGRDITEIKNLDDKLKNSEKKSITWLECSPVCTKIVDLDLNLQYMSSAGITALKIDDVTKYYGQPYPFGFFPDSFKNPMLKSLTRAKETGEVVTQEGAVNDTEGNELWFSSTLVPVKNEKNELDYIIVVSVDITDRKQMEEQIRQSEKMQAIGQLAGGVAHDFNNQLFSILNFAELIKKEVDENSSAGLFIDNIIAGTLRSADLTKKLLSFARKGKYVITNVDVNKIIDETVSMLKHSINKKIEIVQYLNANSSIISGDKSEIQNAILNLTFNSRDAMPDGGRLILSTEIVSLNKNYIKKNNYDISPGEYLKVIVSDNGTGMNNEIQKHIFEPFYTTKEAGKGVGMGMASVYGSVKSHQGAIEVESTLGVGTTISIFFPMVVGGSENNLKSTPQPVLTKGQILIVDDEEMITYSMKLILENAGYKVMTCKNGSEAITLFENSYKYIDLVILDMIMPDLSGEEIFIALKKIKNDVKVLLLSGYSLTKGEGIISKGALGFLQKPVLAEELIQKISDIIAKRKST